MAKLLPEQLLENIRRSGLLDADRLDAAMERYASEGGFASETDSPSPPTEKQDERDNRKEKNVSPEHDEQDEHSEQDGRDGGPPSEETLSFEKYATPEAEHLANWLVDQAKLITSWQREQLLKGRYKGFFLKEYKLLGLIGVGGMARVYLAEHVLIGRRVAIKVLPRVRLEQASCLERFQREAQSIATLDHPNIVRAYDIDADDETHYIVMEYIDGRDLFVRVTEDGPLDEAAAVDCIRQAAEGLGHAHQIGLIHRDVKPSNLLINAEGTVKLLDLGLARFEDDQRAAITLLHDDGILGTADFLAPEQAIDSHNVDARADIYGLGCSLFFALTGEPPYPDGTLAKRILQHQKAAPPSPRERMPSVSEEIDLICRHLMAKRPDDRLQTAFEVADALAGWMILHGQASEESILALTSLRRRVAVRHDVSRLPGTSSDTMTIGAAFPSEPASDQWQQTDEKRSTSVHQFDSPSNIRAAAQHEKSSPQEPEWADDVPLPSMGEVETDALLESFFSELREDAVSKSRKTNTESNDKTTLSPQTESSTTQAEESQVEENSKEPPSPSPDEAEVEAEGFLEGIAFLQNPAVKIGLAIGAGVLLGILTLLLLMQNL